MTTIYNTLQLDSDGNWVTIEQHFEPIKVGNDWFWVDSVTIDRDRFAVSVGIAKDGKQRGKLYSVFIDRDTNKISMLPEYKWIARQTGPYNDIIDYVRSQQWRIEKHI